MQGNQFTDMDLEGYPLGDYLTGSHYDSGDSGLYTLNKGGSDGEENDM